MKKLTDQEILPRIVLYFSQASTKSLTELSTSQWIHFSVQLIEQDKGPQEREGICNVSLPLISGFITLFSEFLTKMNIPATELEQIFLLLAEKLGEELDNRGFKEIAAHVKNGVNERLVRDQVNKIRKNPGGNITIQDAKLSPLLESLGFKNIKEFRYAMEHPIDAVLKGCEGTWKCYVRRNDRLGVLLVSPVSIYQENSRMRYDLKGPMALYEGEIELKNECLFALFKNKNGKEFHHVYRIGSRVRPDLLQGIFSGVSTSNEPIGGRTVIIRTDEGFDQIENHKLEIDQIKKSDLEYERALASYFSKYEANNLILNRVMSYSLSDLFS